MNFSVSGGVAHRYTVRRSANSFQAFECGESVFSNADQCTELTTKAFLTTRMLTPTSMLVQMPDRANVKTNTNWTNLQMAET